MRIALLLACLLLPLHPLAAERLTDSERESLLKTLEKLRDAADAKLESQYRAAISAYRAAMASDDAAMDLYLKCIEKVNFEDQHRKSSEFRDWKRKEADRHSSPGFRLALRYQLRWLVLTLRAASEKISPRDLAVDGQSIIDSLFQDAGKLSSQVQVLGQPVTSTVFARAYNIGRPRDEKWPLTPIDINAFYGDVMFPLLRTPSRVDSLRAAWTKRIQQEIIKVEEWAPARPDNNTRRIGMASNSKPPDYDKFMSEMLPELQWQMEADLFQNGDEAGAARRMLAHLTKHVAHRSARRWGDELAKLLSPEAPSASVTSTSSTARATDEFGDEIVEEE